MQGGTRRFWTTLEGQNPGGSIKDRMVQPELERALNAGEIRPGDTVSEISAGSTAISLAHYCRELELKCRLFIPENCPAETVLRLKKLGADLTACDPQTAYADYEKFLLRGETWPLQQMARKDLRHHYTEWARRHLVSQIKPAAILGATGTGHSLLGVSSAFPEAVCIAAEPLAGEPLAGVRNLTQTNFGVNDPCELNKIQRRIEVPRTSRFFNEFLNRTIQSDHGPLEISDSFRLILAALGLYFESSDEGRDVFLVGSHNRLDITRA